MTNRIVRIINLICSLGFLVGIVLTVAIWSTNSSEFTTTASNNAVIIVSYFLGNIAIVSHFISDKSYVRKQELGAGKKDEKEGITLSSHDEQNQSLVDYAFITKELEKAAIAEGNNQLKSERMLSVLCSNLKAGQGVLFRIITDGSAPKLKVFASYAFVANKNSEEGFEMNDGLLGLAVKEDRKIELTDIPKENVKVFSGLGQSAPSSVVIIPIKNNGEMRGVLELSFIGRHNNDVQKFIYSNMDKIGSLL